jgi:hypothetical protein
MKRRRTHGGTGIATVLIAAGLLVPAGATAAPARPDVTTGPAANIAQSTATLTGSVNPNEAETRYFFEYGTTRAYGARVPQPPASVGRGNRRVAVTVDIGGLAPATTYHYRLVARNAQGVRRGSDRTFRTQRQPLGLSLTATPNPVHPGGRTAITGTLSGTGNADRQIVLQSNPFPYTQGFRNVSDIHLTNSDGTFTFPILSVSLNTQYRVSLPNQPQVESPIVSVGVAPNVSMSAKRVRRTARGAIVRFSGRITPEHDGSRVVIQRLVRGSWVNVKGTIARHRSASSSRYRKKIRLRRGGTFRAFAGTGDGDHVEGTSRAVKVRVH